MAAQLNELASSPRNRHRPPQQRQDSRNGGAGAGHNGKILTGQPQPHMIEDDDDSTDEDDEDEVSVQLTHLAQFGPFYHFGSISIHLGLF